MSLFLNAFGINYDIELATDSRRRLLLESRSDNHAVEQLQEHVWLPIYKFLKNFEETNPEKMTAFTGKKYKLPEETEGICANLYMADQNNKVAYLGTVFSKISFERHRRRRIKESIAEGNFEEAEKWTNCGELEIIREIKEFIVIPLGKNKISGVILEVAMRRYFKAFKNDSVSNLASVTVEWLLPLEKGEYIDSQIWLKAKSPQ